MKVKGVTFCYDQTVNNSVIGVTESNSVTAFLRDIHTGGNHIKTTGVQTRDQSAPFGHDRFHGNFAIEDHFESRANDVGGNPLKFVIFIKVAIREFVGDGNNHNAFFTNSVHCGHFFGRNFNFYFFFNLNDLGHNNLDLFFNNLWLASAQSKHGNDHKCKYNTKFFHLLPLLG